MVFFSRLWFETFNLSHAEFAELLQQLPKTWGRRCHFSFRNLPLWTVCVTAPVKKSYPCCYRAFKYQNLEWTAYDIHSQLMNEASKPAFKSTWVGQSAAVEHTPHDRHVLGSKPSGCKAFYSFLYPISSASLIWSLTEVQDYWFS